MTVLNCDVNQRHAVCVWACFEEDTEEIHHTKLCVVTQSCLCLLNICLHCLSGPPAHRHLNYTVVEKQFKRALARSRFPMLD